MKVVYNDWLSTVRELPSLIRPDWTYQLFIEDSLIFKGHRIVAPQAHREISYLNYLPAATKVQLRACTLVFWKNLNKNIEEMTKWCSILREFQPKQAREPLISIQTEVQCTTKAAAHSRN